MAVLTGQPSPAAITPPAALAVRDLTVIYDRQPALENVTFDVQTGERVAVIGPNGAGKSTLLKTILGLLQAQGGSVAVHVAHTGYIPQYDGVDWKFPVTVRDTVMMGRTRRIGWLRQPGRADWAAVEAALVRVGMADFARRQIGELSGGQRRRVFIARALAQEASLLLLDEPFSGIDASAQDGLLAVLEALNRDGLTILLTTHDLGLAFSRFDRVLALRRRLIACGTAAEVYQPDVLRALYGGRLATWDDARGMMVFVDDPCCG
jgi:ABC-type Mn2+/Zn2+ transport system ATPase subunit